MKMREARKGLRVRLRDELGSTVIERTVGTLTSGCIRASKPPYEEGLFVRVKWDTLPMPENWHLVDLVPVEAARAGEER